MNKKNQQNKVFVPLDLIADAIEMADDEWNQYLDIEEDWYSFQEEQYRQIARDWCESHGFAYDGMENEKEEPEDLDSGENLAWEEVRTEHIVQDEWIDFRKSAYRFPDGTVFEPYYSYSRRDYVVIAASDEEGRYLCVRQFRQGIGEVTTEFPAGGIERKDSREYGSDRDSELSEDALAAAKRELYEETGALDYRIEPVCVYSAASDPDGEETFGMLYYAEVEAFEKELHSEIEKIVIMEECPERWTYPEIQPKLLAEAKRRGLYAGS